MTKTIKWGILSSAKIAENSMVPAIHSASNSELHAVASASGKAAETAASWKAETSYDSYEALLQDETIDAVYIPLPNALHKEWAIKAMHHGKHVLLEKPAAVTSEDIQEIREAGKETGMTWMEAFMYQFHPQHAFVKEQISQNVIGDVRRIRASFSFNLDLDSSNIRLDPELGGGSLYDVGCYCVHVSRFLLDAEPTHVFSDGRYKDGVDISSTALLTFDEADAVLDCSFQESPLNRYEVVGTKGRIEVPFAFRPDQNPNDGLGEVFVKGEDGAVTKHETFAADQFTLQIEHFSQCLLDGTAPSYTPESTHNNMKVIEALYTSQQQSSM
ncbi:Gfo/Idh/MocA family protein [Alkalicoccus urumqiensis]|uniref:Gfo/Idh/MocA family oxidoreductase n=1 Tax=Alkalicoccus urumqiensis TaxID=1548213 RepID=A0A2P6MGU7_ALKUR|nr:Gfo/Idh/MocA family oxidoreductase [Alkalicoccus urumqiensis]PRO65460.1 gfo/Idh/MocA family oxidoreductase [Alkalicoccus urumqiensis]